MSFQPKLIDSASVLVIRDNPETSVLEVLMVKRHHDINFAGGAYVFPGGKFDPTDVEFKLKNHTFPVGYNEVLGTAFREVFEESGIIIGNSINAHDFRKALISQKISLNEFIGNAQVAFELEDVVPFARWVTPKVYSKRFDTRFFLARMPAYQSPSPDNGEIVETIWVEPSDFIDQFKEKMMYPTLMNLKLLGRSNCVEDAFKQAKLRKIVTVEPKVVDGIRTIDASAGYDDIDQENIHIGIKETD